VKTVALYGWMYYPFFKSSELLSPNHLSEEAAEAISFASAIKIMSPDNAGWTEFQITAITRF
jgi:hypothetical protein